MASLGEALFAMLAGEAGELEEVEEFEDEDEWREQVIDMFGSVARAARELNVPRSTLRGWLAGRTPKRGRSWFSGELRRSAAARFLDPDRAARLRGANLDNLHIHGTYRYAGGAAMKGAENRDVPIGTYLREDTLDALIDAYLAGATGDELAEIFAEHITDGGFYADTFSGRDGGHWDIDFIEGLD